MKGTIYDLLKNLFCHMEFAKEMKLNSIFATV